MQIIIWRYIWTRQLEVLLLRYQCIPIRQYLFIASQLIPCAVIITPEFWIIYNWGIWGEIRFTYAYSTSVSVSYVDDFGRESSLSSPLPVRIGLLLATRKTPWSKGWCSLPNARILRVCTELNPTWSHQIFI